ncbi:MAG: transcriptional repressor [Clostridiales bacterium]|nr:transcriptional repressor [Clostridiales bacterium]
MKKTRTRLAVWDELKRLPHPVSAAHLFERLREKDFDIYLSTVYRILDAFVEKQAVIRTSSPDGSSANYGLNVHRNTHLAVCMRCHAVCPVTECVYDSAEPDLSSAGFHVTGHRLEILGYCDSCFHQMKKIGDAPA